jgi:hypothetical protein
MKADGPGDENGPPSSSSKKRLSVAFSIFVYTLLGEWLCPRTCFDFRAAQVTLLCFDFRAAQEAE